MTTAVVVTLLTLLFGIQPISTDLYLPALPTLRHELGSSIGAAQFTLSALIICFGFGQSVDLDQDVTLDQHVALSIHVRGRVRGCVRWTSALYL